MKPHTRNILAIDSAVGEGSVSLWRGPGDFIDRSGEASRAEKIILEIESVLREAALSKADIDLIAVSVGPGSFSGIRIGISTALGLGNALGIPVAGVSVLEALAAHVAADRVVAVVPIGKSDVAWQAFETVQGSTKALADPRLESLATFAASNAAHADLPVVAPTCFLKNLRLLNYENLLIDPSISIASAIGEFASSRIADLGKPQPIYMRNATTR